MKKRAYSASALQRCEYCPEVLFGKQFYLFPCGHGYHCDCALAHANVILGHDPVALMDAKKSAMLIDSIVQKNRNMSGVRESSNKVLLAKMELLQTELDGYIAAECSFCGSVMIRLMGMPLISPEEAEEANSWSLSAH